MAEQLSAQEKKSYLDLDAGLARVRGNKTIFKKMLELFKKSPEFAAFEEQLANGDDAAAAETAHAIKGVTGNLGMTALFETSAQLMTDLREGKRDEDLLARYRQAYEYTQQLVDEAMEQL